MAIGSLSTLMQSLDSRANYNDTYQRRLECFLLLSTIKSLFVSTHAVGKVFAHEKEFQGSSMMGQLPSRACRPSSESVNEESPLTTSKQGVAMGEPAFTSYPIGLSAMR